MQARYADGRAAVSVDATVEFNAEGAVLVANGQTQIWPYGEIRRADDGNGAIILKRRPDSGERISIGREHRQEVRKSAPVLFKHAAREIEGPRVIAALLGAAWALAALFLIGVPLEAKPIAGALPPRWRSQVSEIEWSQIQQFTQSCDDADEATRVLNTLAERLMAAGRVRQSDQVWITIVHAPIPNAFTLPDNQILITDQLIAMADQPDEIAGVLAHEIGHVELNHVMSNVVRHIGAGVFFDVVFGGSGIGQAVAIASVNLSGLSFSRDDEAAADRRGIDYLEAAGIDPGGMARLFDRFSRFQDKTAPPSSGLGTLFSNHPPTAERAALARAHAHAGRAPALSDNEWHIVQRACGGGAASTPSAPAKPQAPANPAPAVKPVPAPSPPASGRQKQPEGKRQKAPASHLPSAGGAG
jgi:Zn-dependent protease with chaperone function